MVIDNVLLVKEKPEVCPLRSVSLCSAPLTLIIRKFPLVSFSNNEGFASGKFGWC